MITDHFKSRGYQIFAQQIDSPTFWTNIDGIAQFLYKDYMISMSTSGRTQGGSMRPVCIFKPGNDYQDYVKDGFHTVQEAIEWVDQQIDVVGVYQSVLDPHRLTSSTYAQAFRKMLKDLELSSIDFNTRVDNFLKQHEGQFDKRKVIESLSNIDMDLTDFQIAMRIFNVLKN